MKKWITALAGWALFIAANGTLPAWWCRRGSDRWFDGEPAVQKKLAAGVARHVMNNVTRDDFQTGSAQFDGEWLFGSHLTAGFGFLQVAIAQPETRAENVRRAEACIEKILTAGVRQFDRDSWRGGDPIERLGSVQDHAAYLGYLNLLLGLARLVNPETAYADLNDRITAHLVARIDATPALLLESYPCEVYPIDNCAVIGGIGLHQRATGTDHRELVARWTKACREKWIEPRSGILFQSWDVARDEPCDAPRGSGTAFGLYFLAFADAQLARDLYAGMCRSLDDGLLNFGAFREYPRGYRGRGDIDSGPVVLGMGLSATGFGISGAKMFGDRRRFARLYASAALAGAPVERHGEIRFATGGPLGNAILFAMLTALPPEKLPPGRGPP